MDGPARARRRWLPLLEAAAAVGAVTLVRLGMERSEAGFEHVYFLYAAAVAVGAFRGGFWPAMAATFLSVAAIDALFVEPRGQLRLFLGEHVLDAVLFLGEGLLIGLLGEARLRSQARLEASYRELERRVAERTVDLSDRNVALHGRLDQTEAANRELVTLRQRLEASNAELQEFASVASHDLQEPLRKIRAFGDRLAAHAGEALDAKGRDYLDRMLNAAGRMSVLIEDLLTFSRVTSKGRAFVTCDLDEVLDGVMSDLEARVEETGAVVEREPLGTIEADAVQMRQLLQNLVGNALKFGKEGERPRVRIGSTRRSRPRDEVPGLQEEDLIDIVVEDEGIGFEQKYADRIFDVFQRLHGRTAYQGTGIGLAVCRKIAQRHGGEIVATSEPGRGATFVVTLPVSHPPDPSLVEEPQSELQHVG